MRSPELPLAALALLLLSGALLIWRQDVEANQAAVGAVAAGGAVPAPPGAVSGGTFTAQERW